MYGNVKVKFIPVKDGDELYLGDTGLLGVSGAHKVIGFKSGPGPQARGWLVVLVQTAATKGRPHKIHAPRRVA